MAKKALFFYKVKSPNVLIIIMALAVFLFLPNFTAKNQAHDFSDWVDENGLLVKFRDKETVNYVRVAPNESWAVSIEQFAANPRVEYAEPDFRYRAAIIPSDTYYDNQWYLRKIEAPEAWDSARESPGIVIAIIDSGVQTDHPDLKDNIWVNKKEIPDNGIDDDQNGFIDDVNGWDFVNNSADPGPKFMPGFTQAGVEHGTIVAGVAAAAGNNAAGVSGITWRARIMSLKVLDDKGEGDTRNVIRAIDYAIANGADIINLSFVGFGYSHSLESAIRRAYNAGVVIVAAAGNEQADGQGYALDETPMYPVCYDGNDGENMVIGVAATDALDQKAPFSGFGFRCVDIAAPGVSIFGTAVYSPAHQIGDFVFNKYFDGYWSGTSMAAPMVSGAAALIETANPELSRREVVADLLDGADNIGRLNPQYLGRLGSGRLNVAQSLSSAKNVLTGKNTALIIAPHSDHTGWIKVTGKKGEPENEFLSYGDNFIGGVNVAAGDVDGDGVDEIITGAGNGGGPHVRIFDAGGNLRGQFFAYDPAFRGGVNVAAGDVDGDGVDEIITGAGNGGGPQVRIFRANGKAVSQFFAYDEKFRGGVRVAAADIDGGARDNKDEIVTAPGEGGGPHIRIFDDHAQLKGQFFAFSRNFKGGVSIGSGDVNNDGLDEIIAGAGPGGAPHVRVFDRNGTIISSFYALDESFSGGVNVGIITY